MDWMAWLGVLGGAFYLFQKIFLALREADRRRKRTWDISSWASYLIGLPPWVAIFLYERNWMAAGVEAGGGPSMVLGLVNSIRGVKNQPRWLQAVAIVCTVAGIAYSVWRRGLTDWGWPQVCEFGIVVGFLIGTYLLSQKKMLYGYAWFILMNVANAELMRVENHPILMWQQVASIFFVVLALVLRQHKR